MVSAEIIKNGSAIDNMTQCDGWKIYEEYLADRESEYINGLKKAKNWDDVLKLQAQLELIDRLRSKVKEWIRNKNKEVKKAEDETDESH